MIRDLTRQDQSSCILNIDATKVLPRLIQRGMASHHEVICEVLNSQYKRPTKMKDGVIPNFIRSNQERVSDQINE